MSNYTTQMDAARKGIVTPEIEKVAKKEKMDVDKLMELTSITSHLMQRALEACFAQKSM
mgnify:CR=1 FL=1